MKPSNYVLFLLLALLVAAGVVACGGDDDDEGDDDNGASGTPQANPTVSIGSTMAQIAADKRITIGVKFDQPGFGFKDPVTGNVEGFDVALGNEIAAAMGMSPDQVRFVETISAERISALNEDRVDLVIATMTINPEREEQVAFSRPYFLAGQSILVMEDDDEIESVDDLNGRRVCTVEGSTSADGLARAAEDAEPLLLRDYADCVAALKDGRVEAVTTDDSILAGFARRDDTVKLVGGTFTDEPYGVAVKKGREDLVEFVDAVLARMLEDGTWDRLYDEHIAGGEGVPTAKEARENLTAAR